MQSHRFRNRHRRTMFVEGLEDRICLAGDVPNECHFDNDSNAEFAQAARSINCFAADFYEHLQAESGNLVVSPASIATALAMFYEGTSGESAAEMERVMRLHPEIASSFAALFDSYGNTLTELTGGRPPAEAFDLAMANAFWPQVGVSVEEDFANTIETEYEGVIQNIDYTDPGAKDIINAWVNENTRGKIEELFKKPISPNTVFTLTNSVYFKALWEMPFDPFKTRPEAFMRPDGTSVDVDMMFFSGCDSAMTFYEDPPSAARWNTLHYRTEIDGFDVFDRQLLGERSSMVFIMPVDPATPNELTPELLAKVDAWMAGPRERMPEMDVYLPKLKTTVTTNLLPSLTGMMPATFPFPSEFTIPSIISDARHAAVMEIDEEGVEAAAVTSIQGVVCFAAGTPVRTPSGDVPIEDIKAGDLVLSRNEHDENGPVRSKVVEEKFTGEAEIWELQVEGRLLRVTELHRFFVLGKGWTSVGDMSVGDLIGSNDNEQWLTTERVEFTGTTETVYNFRVADYHTYFVGKESWGFDIWTHNCCGGETNFPTFRADRPFHFILRENQTSSILFMGRVDDPTQTENELKPIVQVRQSEVGDLNGDSTLDIADADALAQAIVSGTNEETFDLTADGIVDGQDLDRWRALAGAANLPSGAAYPRGDANLDGIVNPADLNVVGSNWQQRDVGFSGGDLNADGVVDVVDLNRIGNGWLEDVSGAMAAPLGRIPRAPLAAQVVDEFSVEEKTTDRLTQSDQESLYHSHSSVAESHGGVGAEDFQKSPRYRHRNQLRGRRLSLQSHEASTGEFTDEIVASVFQGWLTKG